MITKQDYLRVQSDLSAALMREEELQARAKSMEDHKAQAEAFRAKAVAAMKAQEKAEQERDEAKAEIAIMVDKLEAAKARADDAHAKLAEVAKLVR